MKQTALFDSFRKYIFERNREGKLEGVLLQSEFKLLNPDDSAIVPSVPLRTDDGRVRIRCEICRVVFSSVREAAAHLPCRPRSRYRMKREGFFEFMAKISKLGALSHGAFESKIRRSTVALPQERVLAACCGPFPLRCAYPWRYAELDIGIHLALTVKQIAPI